MARDTVFKPGQFAVIEEAAATKPDILQKLVGRTRCDISLLREGVKVLRIVDSDIECQHPNGPRKFLVASRHFTVRQEQSAAADPKEEPTPIPTVNHEEYEPAEV